MKANKALKRLAKIEALLSDVTSEHRVFSDWRVKRQAAAGFECSFEALLQRRIRY